MHPTATSVEDGDLAIRVSGLEKSYGAVRAVRGLDLEVSRGEIFAILGPNGAGKTTTIEILEGYRTRDRGEVSVLGVDPGTHRRDLKARIGIVPQSASSDPFLTVEETLQMYAGYYSRPRPVDELLDVVGLRDKRSSRVQRLSGGQQRRLDVAIALVGDPELLFLDEPTTGFDPSARHEAWSVVRSLAQLGKTVILTTHYMDEAQHLADRVAVVAAGRVVALGTPDTLGARDVSMADIRFRHDITAVPSSFEPASDDSGYVHVRATDVTRTLYELTRWALEHDVELEGLQVLRPTLEDVYLRLVADAEGATT